MQCADTRRIVECVEAQVGDHSHDRSHEVAEFVQQFDALRRPSGTGSDWLVVRVREVDELASRRKEGHE